VERPSVRAVLRQSLRQVLALQAVAVAVRRASPQLEGARVEVSLLTGPHTAGLATTNAGGATRPDVGQQRPQAAAGARAFPYCLRPFLAGICLYAACSGHEITAWKRLGAGWAPMLVAPPGTVQRLLSALAAARWTAQKWQQGGRRGVAVTAHLTPRCHPPAHSHRAPPPDWWDGVWHHGGAVQPGRSWLLNGLH
jgi:hypothetical protein